MSKSGGKTPFLIVGIDLLSGQLSLLNWLCLWYTSLWLALPRGWSPPAPNAKLWPPSPYYLFPFERCCSLRMSGHRFVDCSIYFQLNCSAYLSRGYEKFLKKARQVSEPVHIGLLLFRVLHQPFRRKTILIIFYKKPIAMISCNMDSPSLLTMNPS